MLHLFHIKVPILFCFYILEVAREICDAHIARRSRGLVTAIATLTCTARYGWTELWLRRWNGAGDGRVFITKSKTDSSPFPVRPACLAEHNIS